MPQLTDSELKEFTDKAKAKMEAQPKFNSEMLDGVKCPKCGSLGPFTIKVTTWASLYDTYVDDIDHDVEWEPDAMTYCGAKGCTMKGPLTEFMVIEEVEED